MPAPAARPASWHDVLAAPEGVKAEVLGGELWTSPRPGPAHNVFQFDLAGELYPLKRGGDGGGWVFAIEPDLLLGPHDIVSPNLVGWRRERLGSSPLEQPISIVPDWICEVLSPATASRDRTRKADLYRRCGVLYFWLADPRDRTLEAYFLEAQRWVQLGAWSAEQKARVPPFEEIELDLGRLFPAVA
jgi:Uma2 family endonuclease